MNALIKMTVILKAEMYLLVILIFFKRTLFFNTLKFRLKPILACFFLVFCTSGIHAQTTYTWKTSPVDNNWTNGSNWTKSGTTTTNTYPGLTATDIVVIASGAPTISSGSYTIARISVNNTSSTVQGNLTINNNTTLAVNGTGTTTTPAVSIAGGIIINNGTLSISTTATGAGFGIIFNDAPDKTIATKYDGTGTLNINTSAGNTSSGAVLFNNTITTSNPPNLLFNGTTNLTLKAGAYAIVTTSGNVNAVVGGAGFTLGTVSSPVSNGLINQAGGGSTMTINTGTTLTCVGASSNTTNGVQIAPSTGNANFLNQGTINVSGTYTSGVRLNSSSTGTNTFNNQGSITVDITSPTNFAGALHVAGNVTATNFSITNSGTMSLNNNRFGSNTSTGYAVFIGGTNTPNVAITNSGTFTATGANTFFGGTLSTTSLTNTATGVLTTNYELDKMTIANSGIINFVNTGSIPSVNSAASYVYISNNGTINTNAGNSGILTKLNSLVTTANSVLNPGGTNGYGIIDVSTSGTATMLGTLQLQVAGSTAAGTDYDQMKNTSGTFSLSGLNLKISGLFTPTTNYTPITIISASGGTITGTLASVTGLTSGWSLQYNSTSVQLVYTLSTYFVSPTGNDNNVGSIDFPFLTIQEAFNTAVAGNTINLRAGTYRESVNINTHNITLQAYNNEAVILSGTDVYNNLTWTPTAGNSAIYSAPYTGAAFEQLFFNNKPMIQARWPNLPKDANGDWNYWDTTFWADASKGAVYGTMVDSALSTSGFSAVGAWAVLNVSHQYYTWTRPVLSHTKGSPSFTYAQDLGGTISPTLPYTDDRYYLFGKLDLLDAPGEWFYDTIAKLIYLYPPNGLNPNTLGIEIKNRNYSLSATSDTNLTIQNLTFWATAFKFNSMTSGCNNLVFKNNTVRYSSSTEFFSVNTGQYGDSFEDNYPVINGNNCKITGNTFADGSLSALLVSGYDNLIENNIVHDFNYTSSLVTPLFQVSRTWNSYIGYAGRAKVQYNDFYNGGGVLLSVGQSYNDISNNHFYNGFMSCSGGNKDHSMVYTNCANNNSSSMGTRFHHNWIHDGYCGTTKTDWGGGTGIRGDDTTTGVTMDHLVTWNLGSVGINMKSPVPQTSNQANFVLNNTSFNNSRNNTVKSSIIIETTGLNSNKFSSVYNNAGLGTYGGWYGTAIQYLTAKGNNYDTSSKVLLEDTASFDFRPQAGSVMVNKGTSISGITSDVTDGLPDIGAYERGLTTYWIPGFRDVKTSFPIIPDGSTCVSITRDQLMWKPAYKSVSNNIYFGTSAGSLAFQTTTPAEQNVFALPTLNNNTTYYWRVDAVMSDNSVVTGTVWSFTTKNAIVLSSAIGSNAQTVCINTAITNITYNVGTATGASFSGLPTGVAGSLSGNTVTISGTPSVAGSFSYTITVTTNCGTFTSNGTITVTANNTITRTSAAATTAQTLCINTAITNITYSTVGATGANFSGLPTGVTGAWSSNVITISGTPTVSGSFSYTVTLTGGCGTITASGTITVNATNTVTLSSVTGTDAQTTCINTPITNITYSTTGATGASVTSLQAGLTGSWSGNTVTITGSPTVSNNRTYTVTLTGGCGTVTTTGTINVQANNTITRTSTAATTSQTVSLNTAITNITYSTVRATGATFSGLPNGVNGVWSSNVVTISGTPSQAGTFNYTVTLTGGCGNVTTTGSITVNKATPILSVSGTQTFTYNGNSQGPATINYNGDGTTTLLYTNTSGSAYSSSTPPINAGSYQVVASATAGANYNASTSSAYSFTINKATPTISVSGTQVFTYIGTAQGPASISYSGDGASSLLYTNTSGTAYSSSIPPTNAGSYQVVASAVSTTNYNAATSVTYTFTIGKATATISVSGVQSFTYNGTSQGPSTITYSGDGGTTLLYNNTSGTAYSSNIAPTNAGSYQVVATASAGTNYLAVSSNAYTFTINKANSILSVSGTNTFTYTGAAQGPATISYTGDGTVSLLYSNTSGTAYSSNTPPTNAGNYQVVATATAGTNYNGAVSGAYSFTITKATLSITANNQTVTFGTNASTVLGNGSYTASGFVNGETVTVTTGTVTYSTNYTSTTTPNTAGVTITPSIAGLSATNYTFSAVNGSITVACPTISATLSGTATICSGSSGNISLSITGGNAPYTIVYSDGTSNTTLNNYANNALIAVSPTINTNYTPISVTDVNGCTAASLTGTASISVLSNSTAATSLAASTSPICLGSSTTITQSGGSLGSGAAWKWYSDAAFTTLIGSSSSSNASLSVSPTVTTTYYVRSESGSVCGLVSDNSKSVTVTVITQSIAGTTISATVTNICSGSNTPTTLTQSGGTLGTGATWKWYSNATFTTLVGTSTSPNASLTITPTTTASYYLRAEGTSSPCVSVKSNNSYFVTVTISTNSTAATSVAASATSTCVGSSITLTQTGGTLGTNAFWKWYSDATYATLVGTSAQADASLTVSPTNTTTYYVRAEGCANVGDNSKSVTVSSVTPSIAAVSLSATTTSFCAGSVSTTTLTQGGGSLGSNAVWKWYSNPAYTNLVGTSSSANASLTITPSATTTYYVRAESTSNPCTSNVGDNTKAVTVNVNTASVAATTITASANNLCVGSSTTLTQSGGTLGTSATWKWYSDAAFTNLVGSSFNANASLTVTPTVTTTYYVRAEGTASPCVSVRSNNAFFVTVNMATSNTWTGATNSAWNVPNNWCTGQVPSIGADVIIPNTSNKPLLTSNTSVGAFNLANGATLSLANNTLTINGTISGTGLISSSPTSNLICTGSSNGTVYFSAATKDTTNVLKNLTINTSGTVVLGNSLSLKGTLFPLSGTLNTGGNLTLLSDSNGTARVDKVLGTITGNVTVQRYITAKTARKYSFIGCPVSGSSIKNSWQQQVFITGSGNGGVVCGSTNGLGGTTDKYNSNGFDVTVSNKPSMFLYAATQVSGTRWVGISNTNNTNLIPGKGYRLNIRGDRNSVNTNCNNQLNSNAPMAPEAVTLSATGALTTGDFSVALNDTGVHKYSLIANPYPGQISFTALQAGNPMIDNAMWAYSPFGNGNYSTYSLGIIANAARGYDNNSADIIASGQAFYVRANANGNIVFKENHKTNIDLPNTQFFGNLNRQLIRIKLLSSNQISLDEVVARFNNNGANNYQPSFDAESLNAGSEALAIIKGNNRVAIGSFSDTKSNDTIHLGLGNNSVGGYSLKFSEMETLDSLSSLVLVDQYLNYRQFITTSPIYNFNITGDSISRGNNRFMLILVRNPVLLPININYFNAEMKGASNLLSWKITPNINVRSFIIERSADKYAWQTIGNVPVQQNKIDYTIEDSLPLDISYYRLRQINGEGKFVSSRICLVNRKHNVSIEIFPNPTKEKVWIKVPTTFINNTASSTQLNMYNSLGQKMFVQKMSNELNEIDVRKFAKGWYWIEVKCGLQLWKEKILIQ